MARVDDEPLVSNGMCSGVIGLLCVIAAGASVWNLVMDRWLQSGIGAGVAIAAGIAAWMARPVYRMTCFGCDRVMREGTAPVSQGLCPTCQDNYEYWEVK